MQTGLVMASVTTETTTAPVIGIMEIAVATETIIISVMSADA